MEMYVVRVMIYGSGKYLVNEQLCPLKFNVYLSQYMAAAAYFG